MPLGRQTPGTDSRWLAMDPERTVLLVLGGVRSGKSRYAQAAAARFTRVTFVATR